MLAGKIRDIERTNAGQIQPANDLNEASLVAGEDLHDWYAHKSWLMGGNVRGRLEPLRGAVRFLPIREVGVRGVNFLGVLF